MFGLVVIEEFILLQVMAALLMYEVLVSVIDPKGVLLPALGI